MDIYNVGGVTATSLASKKNPKWIFPKKVIFNRDIPKIYKRYVIIVKYISFSGGNLLFT